MIVRTREMILEKINTLKNELQEVEALSLDIYRTGWVRGTWESDETAKKFYSCHSQARTIKKELFSLRDELKSISKVETVPKTQAAIELEERRAIKEANVTSTTYERAQKRLFNQVNGFLSGKLA